ncbi:hypothetical protein BMR02_12870 [Methylococcaceae bacterium HT1]|nr:hypothetical protein BMR02_12870 [Methylococcaceae bacterium HT1]
MKKTERLVSYYDLSISAKSKTFKCPKPISVREAFELIKLIPLGKRTKVLAKGNESLYMSYFEWTDDIISILVLSQKINICVKINCNLFL